MTFIFDSSIVVSQNWFIKNNSVITEENAENLFWVTESYDVIKEILNQLKKHPEFIDLRSKEKIRINK